MAPASERGNQSTLACKCLNILLDQVKPPPGKRYPSLKESGFSWVYVGENGIRVKFPGATSRERITRSPSSKPGVAFEETQSVKCLLCRALIYKVRINQNSEAPNSKYVVEDTALQSVDGWVQLVLKNCLQQAEAINQAMDSPAYSHSLLLCLPGLDIPSQSTSRMATIPVTDRVLPDLPHFVQPPPFSPSHPAFLTLAKVATQASNKLRVKAETEARSFIQQQLESLGQEEARIYSELDTAWQLFKLGYKEELEGDLGVKPTRSISNSSKDLPLQARPMSRSSSVHQPPKKSLLSSSLSLNAMHYVPAPSTTPAIDEEPPISNGDVFGNTAALRDEAVSFRVLESQLHDARTRAADAQQRKLPAIEKVGRVHVPQSTPVSAFRRIVSNPEPGSSGSHASKSKRKVTFDAEPAVRTIVRNRVKAKSPARRESEVQLFELDGMESLDDRPTSTLRPQLRTPKPVVQRRKSSSPPPLVSSVTPFAQSYRNSVFAALRPKSLPAFEAPIRGSSPILEGEILEHEDEDSVGEDSEDDVDYSAPDPEPEVKIDLGPSSLPIPTNPMWESLEHPQNPSKRLGSIQETDEHNGLPEYALASTAPTARTFQERADELLYLASKPDARLRSQKSVRRKLYDELDRQRRVDPGPEFVGDEGSDTDTEPVPNILRASVV